MKPGLRMKLMAGEAQPNHQVGTEQRMAEDREYRGNRKSQAPWSEGEAEMRYRGEDGRYKSGTRRANAYKRRWEVSVEPQNYQVTQPGHEHIEPYAPMETPKPLEPKNTYRQDMRYSSMEDEYDDPSGRVIGFGMPRNHYESHGGGHQGMQRGMHSMEEPMFDRETAMMWVKNMENEDPQLPHGGRFDEAAIKTMAQRAGVPTEGEPFWEFYAMTNAFYSDFCKVLKKYGVTNLQCYADLAKAWMQDKDAIDEKTATYYECIVKPKMEEGA